MILSVLSAFHAAVDAAAAAAADDDDGDDVNEHCIDNFNNKM